MPELALRSGNIVNNEGHTELRLLLVENFNQYPDLLAWNIAGNVNFCRLSRAPSIEERITIQLMILFAGQLEPERVQHSGWKHRW